MIKSDIKNKLVLALDVPTLDEAKNLVDLTKDYIGCYKVGLELFCSTGLEIVNYIKKQNSNFFMDVKLHDIPNTVKKASFGVVKNGATFFNVHATGGIEMMKMAKAGAIEAYEKYNLKKPVILGVTVLTSISDEILKNELHNTKTSSDFVIELAKNAKTAGLDGVVASAKELPLIKKELGKDFIVLTPGIRPSWASVDDQKRIATPLSAIKDGADFIVLGRAVTKADDKIEALEKIYNEIESGI